MPSRRRARMTKTSSVTLATSIALMITAPGSFSELPPAKAIQLTEDRQVKMSVRKPAVPSPRKIDSRRPRSNRMQVPRDPRQCRG